MGRGGIQSASTCHWSSPGIGSWTPPLLHIHYITGSHYTSTWFLIPLLCWWDTALPLILTRWSNGSCTDLRLPGGHLSMDERTPSTAQPGKDWVSCLLYHSNSTAWFHHPAKFFYNYPIKFSQKYLCNFRWPADFQRPHCKNCSILQVCTSQHQKDQALPYTACCTTSCPGPCHFQAGLLQCSSNWIPSNTIKPLQMIQNAAARLVFSKPKRAHVTSLFISLHWLPVAARIKFKMLMLAFRTATGSAPSYFHSLMTIYISSRSLRSASARRLVVPSQRGSKSLSRTFSFTVPCWWNELPTLIRNAESLTIFKRHLKTNFFLHHLTSS